MTDMVNGEGQSFQNSTASAPVSTPSSAPSSAPSDSERTFRQSEVNDLVGRAKSEAVERYKRDSSMASHAYQPPQQQQSYQAPQQGYTPPAYQPQPGMTEEQVRRITADEATRSRNEWIQDQRRNAEEQNAQRIASEFFTKVGAGEGGIKEFEKLVSESGVDLGAIPHHVQLANQVDNTREVMVELMKNPTKIGAIQNLIDIDMRAGRHPTLALAEIKRLSESLKTNQQGAKYQSPKDPLSQLRPSNAGAGNQGPLSVGDYKRKYRV
jgi:hypothetical protein